jgi:GntR family transcriptional regulator, transcriptional repressor for pyruvate dehydrogenase complex
VKKTHEIVAEQIRRQIVDGELEAGERLAPEEELTAHYGIARTTLREALRVLESQGLIAIRRGRNGGPVVTHPDLRPISTALVVALQLRGTTVGDLDTARQMIEPQIAGQLARSHTEADLEALTAAIDIADDAAEQDDAVAFGLAAAHVHETLVERSGNSTLATLTKLLQDMVVSYYLRSVGRVDQATMRRAVRTYRKLVQLIRAGQDDAAVTLWQSTMTFTANGHDHDAPITLGLGA